MHYKLIVNAIEIYTGPNDDNPKFYSKTDLVEFKVQNFKRLILTFNSLGKNQEYMFDPITHQEIQELKDFFGIWNKYYLFENIY